MTTSSEVRVSAVRLSERLQFSPKQKTCFELLKDTQHTEILYGGGAGGGKSFLGCAWLIRQCIRYKGTRWLMGRSELKTLKQTTLNTFFEVAPLFGLSSGIDYTYNQQSGEIRFADGGSTIILADLKLYPTDPNFDSLGSLEITGAFIDECNQLVEKAWNIVKSRIRFRLDEYGLTPKILGSCNPAKSYVYARFYKPFKEEKLPPERAFVQALVTDNPHVSRHYIENLKGLDKASKERLLFGNWEYDDDKSTLIEYDKILDIWHNNHIPTGTKYITADIARFGGDKTKIAVWDGWRVIRWVVLEKKSTTEVAAKIQALMAEYSIPRSNVIVDEDGVGGGVKDQLGCKGFVANSRPQDEQNPTTGVLTPANYVNLKAQCYFRLADRINRAGLFIAPDVMPIEEKEALIEELEQVKQKDMDKDGKRAVVPKDQVKEVLGRSPDGSDCICFREFFDLRPKAKTWEVW